MWRNDFFLGRNAEQEDRANDLLRDNLTLRQLIEFNAQGSITVKGNVTGTIYRIRKGVIGNVTVVEEGDIDSSFDPPHRCQRLCFEPTPPSIYHLPVGDIMLAQKIILENDEVAALRIAGRF